MSLSAMYSRVRKERSPFRFGVGCACSCQCCDLLNALPRLHAGPIPSSVAQPSWRGSLLERTRLVVPRRSIRLPDGSWHVHRCQGQPSHLRLCCVVCVYEELLKREKDRERMSFFRGVIQLPLRVNRGGGTIRLQEEVPPLSAMGEMCFSAGLSSRHPGEKGSPSLVGFTSLGLC